MLSRVILKKKLTFRVFMSKKSKFIFLKFASNYDSKIICKISFSKLIISQRNFDVRRLSLTACLVERLMKNGLVF